MSMTDTRSPKPTVATKIVRCNGWLSRKTGERLHGAARCPIHDREVDPAPPGVSYEVRPR